ncbi:(Fe-S)-binding protein [Halobacillus shinanisalinarum]|uniref:Lactate utilization protein A n=1 Tax=Halobacillus shinanisalinarum TaxID=2932258 RepID=A0ABY4GYF5_9BACI|nr:(Fe-S)-binding protein [Halobacillus shinanisalinarum]UOQ92909.1 (Fe-S)-binding protein [Halobacillus shinanisalinarum]
MKVSLFITCLGDLFYVNAGKASVELLERLGCEVDFPETQTCCGQPAYNSGYHGNTKAAAKNMIKTFAHSDYVVSPSGSCAYMFHEYEELFEGEPEWREKAKSLKKKTFELTQFLTEVLQVEDVGAEFNGKATYHTSCHMTRLLGVKEAPLKLLSRVKGLELEELPNRQDCCGFGGTFSVKMAAISEQMVDEKINHIEETDADLLIGADGGCLMQIDGRLKRKNKPVKVMHIAEILNSRGES